MNDDEEVAEEGEKNDMFLLVVISFCGKLNVFYLSAIFERGEKIIFLIPHL
jgi:hypothetical protein